MASAVCTIYEGHYHYGVAALCNSLYKNGFRGTVYVGYRGELPPWATGAKDNQDLGWENGKTLKVADQLVIHFLPVETNYHFANFKPDFMLQLMDGPAKEAGGMFYFDPDIIIKTAWNVFESWIELGGIACCADVNSPVPQFHPKRMIWRDYFGQNGIRLQFKGSEYVNSGFIGLKKENKDFLSLWKKIQEVIAPRIGGLIKSPFGGEHDLPDFEKTPIAAFSRTDQDALNATIEAWEEGVVSIIDTEGMSFKFGPFLMSHALGSPKPWKTKIFLSLVTGRFSGSILMDYWVNTAFPIALNSKTIINWNIFKIKASGFISRFYSRR